MVYVSFRVERDGYALKDEHTINGIEVHESAEGTGGSLLMINLPVDFPPATREHIIALLNEGLSEAQSAFEKKYQLNLKAAGG